MANQFSDFSNIIVDALKFAADNNGPQGAKIELIDSVLDAHDCNPEKTLFVGFNPLILSFDEPVFVTEVDEHAQAYLTANKVDFTVIERGDLPQYFKHFDCVIALDEYTTFAESEQAQKNTINLLCDITKSLLITTIRDYKNQDFKDKEFSSPVAFKGGQGNKIFFEYHNYCNEDRYSWHSSVYELTGEHAVFRGIFDRRTMFFKQLAKFTLDNQARKFLVHKNLMHKGFMRRNYEHVVGIEF